MSPGSDFRAGIMSVSQESRIRIRLVSVGGADGLPRRRRACDRFDWAILAPKSERSGLTPFQVNIGAGLRQGSIIRVRAVNYSCALGGRSFGGVPEGCSSSPWRTQPLTRRVAGVREGVCEYPSDGRGRGIGRLWGGSAKRGAKPPGGPGGLKIVSGGDSVRLAVR